MFYWLLKFIFGPIFRKIWIEKVEGLKNIPSVGGVIIASNHESYFDFLLMPAICKRRIYYLAAEKFFHHPLWSILMRFTSQIYVDRYMKDKTEVYEEAMQILKKGKILGIFPEGTRSPDGKLQKAYPGVAKIALLAKVPIIPVGIVGTYEIFSRNAKYPALKKCQINIGQLINLNKYCGRENDEGLLQSITDNVIMSKIAELAGEKYSH